MIRVLMLCFSLALIVFADIGFTLHAPVWLVAFDFAFGVAGAIATAVLWAVKGRHSIPVAFVMAAALWVLFIVGVATNAPHWLYWVTFVVAGLFLVMGTARAVFGDSLSGGEGLYFGAREGIHLRIPR